MHQPARWVQIPPESFYLNLTLPLMNKQQNRPKKKLSSVSRLRNYCAVYPNLFKMQEMRELIAQGWRRYSDRTCLFQDVTINSWASNWVKTSLQKSPLSWKTWINRNQINSLSSKLNLQLQPWLIGLQTIKIQKKSLRTCWLPHKMSKGQVKLAPQSFKLPYVKNEVTSSI